MTAVAVLTFGFNTQPPEGGWFGGSSDRAQFFSFNTQPPEGGWVVAALAHFINIWFQHTAARRRLVTVFFRSSDGTCFNTQPPEGGWPAL